MNALMYLKRLEDFTPRIALKVLNHYIKSPNIKIRKGQLNLIKNGICDSQMKKYVVSIGDALYQIVAVDTHKSGNNRVKVVVDSFQLCGTRRSAKELKLEERPKEFTFTNVEACNYLKECMPKEESIFCRLHPDRFNRVNNGILDDNMIKYVLSTGYGLYQIVAINNKGIISLVVKYSQI